MLKRVFLLFKYITVKHIWKSTYRTESGSLQINAEQLFYALLIKTIRSSVRLDSSAGSFKIWQEVKCIVPDISNQWAVSEIYSLIQNRFNCQGGGKNSNYFIKKNTIPALLFWTPLCPKSCLQNIHLIQRQHSISAKNWNEKLCKSIKNFKI